MEKSVDPPVTVLVTRRPKPGKERAFEDYLAGITQAALQHQGHMGTNIFRPSKPGGNYRIIFKFDRRSNLERWEGSAERAEWRAIAEQVSEPRQVETISGLEAWFTLPACAINVHPPKYKMALVVWMGVFSLVTLLSSLLGPLMSAWPRLLQTIVLTALVVVCLTYAVMPLLTRLFSGWLYASKDQK
ncbi:antibiotic biosynthesis monooxygenase [Candidatus Thiodiazotropha sp. LNASS1]|uniref:antibiotic biosynthesis monooxygenase n=1 Tax=Candidatus Thiodiazotropha sp. LNASS1 TaxID=3096260 RepID=UPI0034DFBBBC